jgi:transposase
MATERLPMRRIREILRLRREQGLSVRETARALGVSVGVVSKTASRAEKAGITWEVAERMTDAALEERMYGRRPASPSDDRPRPNPVHLHTELRRPGVTLEVLHLEYLEHHPTGLRYTAFCDVYRRWLATASVTMRQVHKAGEKCFVDYSGKTLSFVDPTTGQRVPVELFVAVLGASNLTYAEATLSQKVQDFVLAHVHALTYFGGALAQWVPDQLKSAVVVSCRYEPGIQRTYADFARHYDSAVVPARPHKPRDKAKVEAAVLVVQRWILARLRNEIFFSLESLNRRIRELLDELNARPMKKLGGISRRELFERVERSALRPLPSEAYEYADWHQKTLNTDYHVEIDKHWYSAPHRLAHQEIWARVTAHTVELFHLGERVASHRRSAVNYKHTTEPSHMPEAHRRHAAGPDSVLSWAESVGPMTTAMVKRLLDANPVREQGWRSARGLQRVGETYGAARTEQACGSALRFGARSYKPIERLLVLGRESLGLLDDETPEAAGIQHENVRGPDYYH